MQRAQWTQHPQNRAWQVAPLLLALLLMLPVSAFAQVSPAPSLMNFQGRLAKPDGTPVPDGAYSIKFSLFDALANGNQKWTQTVGNVSVHNGVFAVLLSGFAAGTFNGNLWLEIKVGNDNPLTPRQQLVSVAYAFKANSVPDGSIGAAQIADGSITSNKFANNLLNTTAWLLNGNSSVTSGFLGTTDAHPLLFKTNGVERMRIREDGIIGIGTTTPIGSGRLVLSQNVNDYTGMYIDSGASGWPFYGYSLAGIPAAWTYLYGPDGSWRVYNNGNQITVTNTGNVGIGTTAPGYTLDVNGTIHGMGLTGVYGESNSNSAAGTGVTGTVTQAGQFGVLGNSSGALGLGVVGTAGATGEGVVGFGSIGVEGGARFAGGEDILNGTGVYGSANKGTSATGVSGHSDHGYGVYGSSSDGYGVYSSGKAGGTTGWANVSDARYKTNVQTLPDALDTILNLRGVHFEWRRDEFQDKHFPAGRQVGFIAQEIEKVLPGLVYTDKDGYKSVVYANVVPVLVEAVKTLKQENDAKEKRLSAVEAENAKLKARLEAIEQALARGGTQRR